MADVIIDKQDGYLTVTVNGKEVDWEDKANAYMLVCGEWPNELEDADESKFPIKHTIEVDAEDEDDS